MVKNAQMKIQQMALMIIAVFIFFMVAGLFMINIKLRSIGLSAQNSASEEAEATMELLASFTEFNYIHSSHCSNCLDADKLEVISRETNYSQLWPIASLKVYKIHPTFSQEIKCPAINCNYYEVIKDSKEEYRELSTYVDICKKEMNGFRISDKCELAKLLIGIKK